MKNLKKFKKIALFSAVGVGIVGVSTPFLTSCSAASTVPDFLANTYFNLSNDSNSFRITQSGIKFDKGGIGADSLKTSPSYKLPKEDNSDKAEVDKNNTIINQFSLLQTLSTWVLGYVLSSSDLLANCYDTGVINEATLNVDPAIKEISKLLGTYKGTGSEVKRYRIKTLTFVNDTSSISWTKTYGSDPKAKEEDLKPEDNVLTYTTDVKLDFSYWYTSNGQNVNWVNDSDIKTIYIRGLKVSMVPSRTKMKDGQFAWSGLYNVQNIDKIDQIQIGVNDAAKTNSIATKFLPNAKNHMQGSIINSDLNKFYKNNIEDFKIWIKTFSA